MKHKTNMDTSKGNIKHTVKLINLAFPTVILCIISYCFLCHAFLLWTFCLHNKFYSCNNNDNQYLLYAYYMPGPVLSS